MKTTRCVAGIIGMGEEGNCLLFTSSFSTLAIV